jgi:oligogalacturonide lyase
MKKVREGCLTVGLSREWLSPRVFRGALLCAVLTTTAFAAELRDEWIDAETGHRVVRLSRVPGESMSLYFHDNEFTAAGDRLVFENRDRSAGARGNYRIYVYDFASKRCDLINADGGKVISVAKKTRQHGFRDAY